LAPEPQEVQSNSDAWWNRSCGYQQLQTLAMNVGKRVRQDYEATVCACMHRLSLDCSKKVKPRNGAAEIFAAAASERTGAIYLCRKVGLA
jgi:hypothetical protein